MGFGGSNRLRGFAHYFFSCPKQRYKHRRVGRREFQFTRWRIWYFVLYIHHDNNIYYCQRNFVSRLGFFLITFPPKVVRSKNSLNWKLVSLPLLHQQQQQQMSTNEQAIPQVLKQQLPMLLDCTYSLFRRSVRLSMIFFSSDSVLVPGPTTTRCWSPRPPPPRWCCPAHFNTL